jgi:uncharacterized membrane protein
MTSTVSPSAAEPARATKPRITFVDVLRLLALAQMINGHTLDAVMLDSVREGPIFSWYNYVRGLVSVAFLLAAGFSYSLTTVAKLEEHKRDPALRRKRLGRGLLLLFLGYALQFRTGMLHDADHAPRMWAYFWRVDVLHCIGFGILAQEAITRVARTRREVALYATGLATVLVALAPIGDALSEPGPWSFLTNWLGQRGGSLFPVLPWSAYTLLGCAIATTVLPEGTRTPASYPWSRILGLAALALALRYVLRAVPYTLAVEDTAWGSRPEYFVAKLATVLFAVAVLALAMQRVPRLRRWVTTIAGETLIIYVFHLPVLYSFPWSPANVWPHALPLSRGLVVVAVMAVLCTAVGLGWSRSKPWRERMIDRARATLGGAAPSSAPAPTTSEPS